MTLQRRIKRFRLTTSDGKTIFEEEIDVASVPISEVSSIMNILKIISNESRFRVISWIAEKKSSSFKELCNGLGYSQKTIAQSLDDLLKVNVITKTPEGYILSPLGRMMVLYFKELASIIRKISEFERLMMEFE
ncbi:MAG: ArsR family transcriptional regulator [Candidatus Bathyarchaeota archaeon]